MIKLCQWDITGNCNLSCLYCREKRTESLPYLSLPQIYQIIDQFEKMEVKTVAIAGGEPLTLPYIFDVLEYLQNKVESVSIITNGTLITKDIAKSLAKYCKASQVSIDGSCAEVHEHYRGKGSFDRAIRGLKLLMESGLPVVPRLTIGENNLSDTANYITFVHSIGLKRAALRRVLPSGNSAGQQPIKAEELKNAFKVAYDKGQELGVHVGSSDYFSQLYFDKDERRKAITNLSSFPGKAISGCSMGIETFYLAQNGMVLFCPYFPVVCGNLLEQELSEIWANSKFYKIMKNLRQNKKGKCASCYFLNCCGGCPAYVYLTTGDIVQSDDGCWLSNEEALSLVTELN